MIPGLAGRRRWLLVCAEGVDAGAVDAGGGPPSRPPFQRLPLAGGDVVRLSPGLAPAGEDAAILAARRGVGGVLVVIAGTALDASAAALVRALSARRPGLALAVLLVDASLPGDAPMGGGGETPAAVLGGIAGAAAGPALAAAAQGELAGAALPALTLPARLACREPAWRAAVDDLLAQAPGARFAGLWIVGPGAGWNAWRDVLHPLLAPAPPRPRGRHLLAAAGVAGLLALSAGALATWRLAGDLERQVGHHAEAMRHGLDTTRLSPPAVAGLGALASLVERGDFGSALVPASWGGEAESAVGQRLAEQMRLLLIAPVQRRLAQEEQAIAADIEHFAESPVGEAAQETERTAALLRRIVAFDGQVRAFRHEAPTSPRAGWEPLASWSAGTAVGLAWIDTSAGTAAFATAISQAEAPPPRPLDQVERVLALSEERLAPAGDAAPAAVAAGRRAVAALADAGATGPGDPVAELLAALDALVAGADASAAESAADDVLYAAQEAAADAGLLDEAQWWRNAARRDDARRQRSRRLLTWHLDGIGPVFEASAGLRPIPSRQVLAARQALADMVREGFALMPALPPADLGELATQAGAPAPVPLAAAARRMRAHADWLGRHRARTPALPDGLAARLGAWVAAAAARELGAAYRRPPAGEDGPHRRRDDALDIAAVLAGLAATDRHRLADAAWLVGVRAYRQIEAVDAAYKRGDGLRLAAAVAGWDGEETALPGHGWAMALRSGLDRLRELARQAAPPLRVLMLPAVAEALGRRRLIEKWRRLAEAAAEPEKAAGYQALRTYVVDALPEFRLRDCAGPDRLPATAGLPDGPFTEELAAIREALTARCQALWRAPPPPGPAANRVPW